MEFIYFIIIIIIFINCYLLYIIKNLDKKTAEKFEIQASINQAINDQYNSDINDIKTISTIYKNASNNNDYTLNVNGNNVLIKGKDTLMFGNIPIYQNLILSDEFKYNSSISIKSLTTNDFNVNDNFNNILPVYSVVAYNSDILPIGWALCTGDFYKMNTTTMKIEINTDEGSVLTPDLRGRFVYAGKMNDTANTASGKDKVVLGSNQIPSHNHSKIGQVGGIIQGAGYDNTGVSFNRSTVVNPVYTDNEGGGLPHNNMPPYYVLNYIMKIWPK